MEKLSEVTTSKEVFARQEEFDTVCLVAPLGREGFFYHRDMLGLGNQIGSFVAAKCLAPTKKIVGYHKLQIVTPWSLLSRGRRLDFLRRSQLAVPSVKRTAQRFSLRPPVTGQTFIDRDRRVLYLSCEFANKNTDLFSRFETLELESLRLDLKDQFGVTFPSSKHENQDLAAHYRLGDFAEALQAEDSLKVNTRMSFDIFACKLEQAISKTQPQRITLFSDGDLSKQQRSHLVQLSSAHGASFRIASKWQGGRQTFEQLLKHSAILASNSTLSAWAAILGQSRGLRAFQNLPVPSQFHRMFELLNDCS